MPKFVKRAVLLGIFLAVPQAAQSGENDFPVLNSIGRFWGVGYTQGGYHAAQDGRFDVVTHRHPASNYRSGGLPQYSQPLYSPSPHANLSPSPVLAPTPAGPKSDGSSMTPPKPGAKLGEMEALAPPKPATPSKPAGPPPRWLEDYLQDEDVIDADAEIPPPRKNVQPSEKTPETSPSDLLREQPAEDAVSTILAPPTAEGRAKSFEQPSEVATSKIELGKEAQFSILEASYPLNSHRARTRQIPSQSPAVRPVNRYR